MAEHAYCCIDVWSMAQMRGGTADLAPGQLPPGFAPPVAWSGVKVKLSGKQQEAQLEEVEKRFLALEGADWDALLIAEVRRWYDSVCSSELVQWNAALHSAFLPGVTKSGQIDHLIAYRLRPIPTVQIEAFARMYEDLEADDLAAISEAEIIPPPRPASVDQGEPPDDAKANVLNPDEDGFPNPPKLPLTQAELLQLESLLERRQGGPGQGKDQAGMEAFGGALVKVLQGLTEKIAPPKKKAPLQPLDMLLKKAKKAILKGEFFEISALNPDHLAKLKLMPMQGGMGAKKVTVNAITLTAEGYKGKVDWSAIERWDLYRAGFPKWVTLMLNDPLSAGMVADRLAWFSKLCQYSAPDIRKVQYAKNFHCEYAKRVDWEKLFDTESSMLITMAMGTMARTDTPDRGRKRDRGGRERGNVTPDDQPTGGRGRGGRGGRGRGRDAPHGGDQRGGRGGKGDRPVRICYSRLKKDKGECTYAGCRFVHACASCGADHAACNCPRWDEAKAAAILAKQLAK